MTEKLSHRERHFLSLLIPDGSTIQVGLSVGASLQRRGLVTLAKYKRYGITEAGRAALAGLPHAANEAGRGNGPARQAALASRPRGRGTGGGTGAGTGPKGRGQAGQDEGQLTLI